MDVIGIEDARRQLGEIVDRARLAKEHTSITRQGKPAAVIVNSDWYAAVTELLDDMETLESSGERTARAYEARLSEVRRDRRAARN
jgi:prevent-host-death family protein